MAKNAREFAMTQNSNLKLAVLIEADNAPTSAIQELLSEVPLDSTAIFVLTSSDLVATVHKCW